MPIAAQTYVLLILYIFRGKTSSTLQYIEFDYNTSKLKPREKIKKNM